MKRATVTIPEELERAMESYRGDLDFPPSLAQLMKASLAEYLGRRGYSIGDGASSAPPSMMVDAPRNRGSKTASGIVAEDRR